MIASNKSALITGASSGIGAALALQLAAAGWTVHAWARRAERLANLRDRSRNGLGEIIPCAGDLLEEECRSSILRLLRESTECPDLVVNNAGVGVNRRFDECDPDRLEHLVRLDLETPILFSIAAARTMAERGEGSIVNVASIAGFQPTPYHAAYSAAKAALISFSEALAEELRDLNVTVTCVCPGVTDTEFFAAGDYLQQSPVYRMRRASAEEVARAALSLADRHRVLGVVGARNRILAFLSRVFPRRFVIRVAGRLMRTTSAL